MPARRSSATPAPTSSRAWAAEGGAVVPIPGASAVLAAVVGVRHRRAALGVRGVPAADAAATGASGWPGSPPTSGHDRVRGARPGRRDPARPGRGVRRRTGRRGVPRADQGPRDDRPGDARRAGRRGGRRRHPAPRRVRRSSWSAAWAGRPGHVRHDRRRRARRRRAPRSSAWSAAGMARGEAARQVAATTGDPAPRPLRAPERARIASRMTAAAPGRRACIPILGPLSPIGARSLVGDGRHRHRSRSCSTSACTRTRRSCSSSAARDPGARWVVGISTERLGALTGPQVGGILNATFGNIAELIIAFFALQAGLIEVVKASLTGSIIGNLLLVLGASMLVGGLRHGTQTFSAKIAGDERRAAGAGADRPVRAGRSSPYTTSEPTPGHAHRGIGPRRGRADRGLRPVAGLPVHEPRRTLGGHGEPEGHAGPAWSGRVAIVVLLAPAACSRSCRRSWSARSSRSSRRSACRRFFVGVVLIPTIGNLAEHLVAVQLAAKDKMEFAMAVTFGSSLQVALFVAPVLVLFGRLIGQPMDLSSRRSRSPRSRSRSGSAR